MTLFESEDSFLSLWFKGCEGSIEGRAIRGNEVSREFFPVDEPRKAVEWAVQYQGWNVFYGICPRKDDSSGRESNLRDLPGLAVDLDFKDFEGGETEVWALIDGFKYPASLLVHSGGGFHAYWKFRDPVPPTQKLKAQLKGLCRALRGDQAATDLSRLLRLPGTWNYKYNPPIPVRVLRITDVTYTPYDFAEFEVELAPDGRPVELNGTQVPEGMPERFEMLLQDDPGIRSLWEQDPNLRFRSGRQTPSEYAAALMVGAGRHGFSDSECAAILRAFYARPGMKPLHPQKEALTLRFAREGRADGNECGKVGLERVTEVGTREEGPLIEVKEQIPDEAPADDLLPFPEKSLLGLAGEFAATYAERLESPQQFFYLDYLNYLGAILSKYVRLDTQLREEPRIYGVKVGQSWLARKSSSQEEVYHFFFESLAEGRLVICHGAGSAEGLAKRMNSQPGVPTLLVYDELRTFVDKAGVQGSVLLPMVTSLFSQTVYENSTKHSEIRLSDAHLSLLGACTIDTFTTMFSPQFRSIGALNRLLIVAGRRGELRPIPKPIPSSIVTRLQKRTGAQIARAERDKPVIAFTAGGRQLWEEYYRALPESPYSARLDTYGLRLLMLFAITCEAPKIDRSLVEAVIAFLDYEYHIRRDLDPVDAENAIARLERLILRNLGKGRMSDSRLRDRCHAQRTGLWAFDQALKNVKGRGWVVSKKVGRGLNHWLTEAGKEASPES